ncbi:MAG: hypothetical protein JZU64_03895 [Rhodoferax sp.]|jgi:hypothetical protein|nr:hypothetical protein [Rhodoferax sp.]
MPNNDFVNGTLISDAGNTFASASTIPGNSNSSIAGSVGGTDPYDCYKFVATDSGTASFMLYGLSQDTNVYLFGSSQNFLNGSNDSGLSAEYFSYSSITAGNTYYIIVEPTGVSDYKLSVILPAGASTTPDLVVSSINASASVAQGSDLTFSYVAKNQGSGTTDTHYAVINVDQQASESNFIAYNGVAALSAGATQTLTNSISTAGLSVGQHTLYIKEDGYYNYVTESDETNNVRSVTFNVTSAAATTQVLWGVRDVAIPGLGAGANHHFLVILPSNPSDPDLISHGFISSDLDGDGDLDGFTIGADLDGWYTLGVYKRKEEDIAAIKGENRSIFGDSWNYESHPVPTPETLTTDAFVDRILNAYISYETYQASASFSTEIQFFLAPWIDGYTGNCASWVNTTLQVAGLSSAQTDAISDFTGADWGADHEINLVAYAPLGDISFIA